jgi:hypothetical protein
MKPTARRIELPSIESLPQTVCRNCNRSLINGLFTPQELFRNDGHPPRCRSCIGDINARKPLRRLERL